MVKMTFHTIRLRWIFIIFLFFSLSSFSHASTLDGICTTIQEAAGCKATINLPSLSIKTCKQDFFKVDPCKTKFKGRYPCGVSWSGIKWCDGWTCSPGTVKTVITVPCGVNVGSQKVDLCGLVRKAIPGADELVRQGVGYCKCLPKVFDLISLDTVKAVVSSYDISAGTGDILEKYGDIQQCMIDNSFNVQDNKNGLTAGTGALVQSDSVKIFTAAEINLARYTSFALAISPCFIGGCSETLVRGWFTDYLTDSEKAMATQIKTFLSPWEKSFDGIQNTFTTIGGDLEQVGQQFGTIQQSVEGILNDFCKNFTSCADTTVAKLKAKVDDTIQNSQAIIGLKAQITTAVTDTQELVKIVSDAISAFDTLSDLGIDAIWAKVLAGQLRSIKEIAETLQAAKRLPNIISDLQKVLPKVQEYVKQLENLGPDFIKNIDDIVSSSWLNDAKADAARYANGEAAVQKIQTLFQDNIVSHVTSLSNSITSVLNSLTALALSGPPAIDVRVASYQRWSQGHFDMPCLTTGKVTLSLGGYKKTVDYPKFYRCSQTYSIPFPNHHIPYVKLAFGASTSPPASRRSIHRYDKYEHEYGIEEKRQASSIVTVGVDQPTESIPVDVPTITESAWPYVSDQASGTDVATVAVESITIDPSATEIVFDTAASTSFAIPTDLYTAADQASTTTSYPASLVFFETTDANGAVSTAETTLTNGTTLEVSATIVMDEVSSTLGGTYTTPAGFVDGELSGVSVAPSSTPAPGTSATSAAPASTTSAKSSGGMLSVNVPFGVGVWLVLILVML